MNGMHINVLTRMDPVIEQELHSITFSFHFVHEQADNIIYNTNFVETVACSFRNQIVSIFERFTSESVPTSTSTSNNDNGHGHAPSNSNMNINDTLGPARRCGSLLTHETCTICHCEYQPAQLHRKLPCQHVYHKKCIDRWLKTSNECPLCRASVL